MKKNPIKVLHVIHALGMGGAETWLMEVLRLWAKTGEVQMDFLLTSGKREIFDDEAVTLGARLFYCQYGRGRLLSFARQFRKILRDGCYDAIHDHQAFASGWHYWLGSGLLPKVRIVHVHNAAYQINNDYGISMPRRFTAWIGRLLVSKYATYLAGTSEQLLAEYEFNHNRFRHIPRGPLYCGIATSRFHGDSVNAMASLCRELNWPTDAKILLFVGRIDRSAEFNHTGNAKNAPFAVAVGMQCAVRDKRVHLILAGQPSPATKILEARIAAGGLAGRILFLGIRHDLDRLMLASDLLLFPSRGEGLGMVAVEAQAAGLPVLASSAVPRECMVVENMVRFLDVTEDLRPWVETIEVIIRDGKPNHKQCNTIVACSAFSIHNSAKRLIKIYQE
jgi:glycosyltransferase EpsF